jgi:ArsR family transcriptional regulator
MNTDTQGNQQIPENRPNSETLQDLADLFKHLSDPRRLQLLLTLAEREPSVGQLAEILGVTSSAVSHQLQTLRRARLVAHRREGKTVYYRLIDDHVHQLVGVGLEHVTEPRG